MLQLNNCKAIILFPSTLTDLQEGIREHINAANQRNYYPPI